ncbi:DUF4401 domain-containing protein [Vreelandella zhaodongensis]|uniref:DUF4401 domain-containing protein n=1 Tax=Vreelandella zhaodongensis TaxID=1176240 RepID=A0ABX2SSC8_VREZH|nr:DUF4401 domain-containing protein [Halomonas zhaodongensis]NYS45030.1 DUF4401 domain-containing protein [Halomonas zhaodongensis]
MNRPVDAFKQRLAQAGVVLNEPSSTAPLESPWFVRALQAFSGWLAALFLLGFIAMGVIFVAESAVASLVVGGILIGGAFALLRTTQSDVLEHMALVFSLAGQLLVAWAVVEMLSGVTYLWWALLGLQCVLALIMPSQVHRSFSAFLASLALYMALASNELEQVAIGLVLLALTLLWLNEYRWPERIKMVQAWCAGLLVGLLLFQGVVLSGESSWVSHHSPVVWLGPWAASWLSALLEALALLYVIHTVLHQHSQPAMGERLAIYGAIAAVAVVSVYVPGLGAGITVLLLGFAISHRKLMASGILLLLLAVSSYYYWLDVTLLIKALLLFVMGSSLLALRWVLRRWLRSLKPAERSDQ